MAARRRRWPYKRLIPPTLVLAAALFVASRPRSTPPTVLRVPVEGVRRRDLVSTFGAPRDGGRRKHEGADIFSKKGTLVVAAAPGRVVRIGNDRLGGRVVSVLGAGNRVYSYAHLDRWAEGLKVGQRVGAGDPLGTVGNTGNARTTPPHLHFAIFQLGLFTTHAMDPVPSLRVGHERDERLMPSREPSSPGSAEYATLGQAFAADWLTPRFAP
jgi:peptidoglycan LD-endopeptidase LytH